jgi:hypothetical protein
VSTHGSIPRRDVLAGGGVLAGVLLAGGPLSLLAPGRVWALEMKVLTEPQGAKLLAVARTIAPHDGLEDAAYALVVKAVDEACVADEGFRTTIRSGLDQLAADFAARSEAERVEALKTVEHTDFFAQARAKTLGNLYASALAYAHFGYEGEAFSKGGYLFRGFNDLKWLPEVPLEDSGPMVSQTAP